MEGARYLEDGKLTVFRRAGIYYARLRLAGSPKYITRSLKTSNEQTAIDYGRRLLFQIEQRADQGLPPKSKIFGAVIDDYIRYRERDHRHGGTSAGMLRQIIRVSKFWREYVGHVAVEEIDDKVMRAFIPWRREYFLHPNRTYIRSPDLITLFLLRNICHLKGVACAPTCFDGDCISVMEQSMSRRIDTKRMRRPI